MSTPPGPDIWEDEAGQPRPRFDLEALILESYAALRAATRANEDTWRMGQESAFVLDQALRVITFHFDDGTRVQLPAQVVGLHDLRTPSFDWAWASPKVPIPMQQDALHVKALGAAHDFKELSWPQVIGCTEERCWTYAALVMKLAGARCAYRIPIEPEVFAYLTLGEPTILPAA